MPFNIRDFQSQVARNNGFAKTGYFDVIVKGPSDLSELNLEADLKFRIDSVDIPGRSVSVLPFQTYGPPEQVGARVNYVPITFTCLVSPNLIERNYFMAWQDLIGGSHRSDNGSAAAKSQFDVGYYKEYAKGTTLTINHYEESSQTPTYTCQLLECFPSQIGSITNSWSNVEVVRMPVTIVYRYFLDQSRPLPESPTPSQSFFSRLNQSGVGGLISTGVGVLSSQTGPVPFAIGAGASSVAGIVGGSDRKELMYKAARIVP